MANKIQVTWQPVPKGRNLGRGQIPPARHATVSVGGTKLGGIREGYGSRFGRTYDAFNNENKMIARNTTLELAIAAFTVDGAGN